MNEITNETINDNVSKRKRLRLFFDKGGLSSCCILILDESEPDWSDDAIMAAAINVSFDGRTHSLKFVNSDSLSRFRDELRFLGFETYLGI